VFFDYFAGVVGAIDCTHIKIESPGGNQAELFRNRKTWFSLNVQAVCNSEGIFTNVVARWPVSVHDSRIFENSYLAYQLENKEIPGLLLGDSGYPVLPYLLTPLDNPVNAAQKRYLLNYVDR
jgi:nuclease HARBI1